MAIRIAWKFQRAVVKTTVPTAATRAKCLVKMITMIWNDLGANSKRQKTLWWIDARDDLL